MKIKIKTFIFGISLSLLCCFSSTADECVVHDKEFVGDISATCTQPLKHQYRCRNCGITLYSDEGEPSGHSYARKWYTIDGYDNAYWQMTCTKCNQKQGEPIYGQVPVEYITIDNNTQEILQTVSKMETFDTLVRGDSLGTEVAVFDGIEYRYIGADGTGGDVYARPGLKVYRRMEKNKYTIYFNANGGTGDMTPLTVTYGQRIELPACTLSYPGHTFLGWGKSPTGTVEYSDKSWSDKPLRSPADSGARCDLYAIWESKDVVVSFQNAKGSIPEPVRVKYGQPYGELPEPAMDSGFIFKSWKYIEPTTGVDYAVTPTTLVTREDAHTLIADYSTDTITVIFVSPSKTQSIETKIGNTINPPFTPYEDGKKFLHWSDTEGGSPYNFNKPVTGDSILYAVFDNVKVTAKLMTWGNKEYYYPAKIGELPAVDVPGKRFIGWFWDEKCTSPVSSTDSIPITDFILYPKLTTSNYILSLNTTSQRWEMKYGDTIPALPVPRKGNAKFKYWEYDGEIIKTGDTYKWSKDVQLISRWDNLEHIISFPDGTTKVISDGDSIGVMPTPPSKVGMTFVAYTDQDGIAVRESTVPNRDLQLRYKYSYNDITLTLIDDGYTQTIVEEAGSLLDNLPTRNKPGYSFVGWSITPNGSPTIGPLYEDTELFAIHSADYQDIFLQDINQTIRRKTGENLGALPEAYQEGMRFDYWTYDGAKVTSDTKTAGTGMTLIAHFTPLDIDATDLVEIRFWCDGVKINTIDLVRGDILHDPGKPALSVIEPDRHFMYWTTDIAVGTKYEFEKYVDTDIDLYAKWSN